MFYRHAILQRTCSKKQIPKRHLENTIYDSKQDAGRDCEFSTLFQSHLQTEEDDFEIKSKIYILNLPLVLNHISYSQDVLSFRNLFFTLLF